MAPPQNRHCVVDVVHNTGVHLATVAFRGSNLGSHYAVLGTSTVPREDFPSQQLRRKAFNTFLSPSFRYGISSPYTAAVGQEYSIMAPRHVGGGGTVHHLFERTLHRHCRLSSGQSVTFHKAVISALTYVQYFVDYFARIQTALQRLRKGHLKVP
jgi:hypothetical protein